ncbi:MAG TPA: cache domain-containing protein [Kouleothrix sp.]|uniref:sensor histidine kinase n=1 Tax=Kouleothrix sp. TaxID=2779161 RepID=UPI002BB5D4B0|nr:cache domain-containing protein [Kouleothrix sp.]HRC75294.1 cache domain-containing protein [Kouleothrix sp.]
MRLIHELRSHLQYKIILPFLLLTLVVALAGSAVAFLFITGNAQERLNNQLVQVARDINDKLVQQESDNLLFLREVVFAQANPQANAPAVADALVNHDSLGLERALDPYFRISSQRTSHRIDRMIAFDNTGHSLIDWERPTDQASERTIHPSRPIDALWFVPRILAGQQDARGDKYAGLLELGAGQARYLFTVAPVMRGGQVVGGVVIATRLDTLLQELSAQSQAAIVVLYRGEDGIALESTSSPTNGLAELNIRRDLIGAIRALETDPQQAIFDVVRVNQREYQFAYAPLRVRGDVVGILSVALARDYVTGTWSDVRWPLTLLTLVLMLAIIGLGIFIAQQITRPLQELVSTAQAVSSGDLARRSKVAGSDEVGLLAQSFNNMTGHLLSLYRVVRAEASQRAAIVESITDGVVVCDSDGKIMLLNRATRQLLSLADGQSEPEYFADMPLAPFETSALAFGGTRAADLFTIDDRVVRVNSAPVLSDEGIQLGQVYVLQDMTSEVAVDRAKTNFIATISHELRTPLMVLGGTSELLLRNLAGPIPEDQRTLLEAMRKNAQAVTALLNNVITIAGLESGTLHMVVEPVELAHVLDGMVWPIRKAMNAKGLSLILDIPEDLPELLADEQHLRIVVQQLLDNARRYTEAGTVTLRARREGASVRVDVADTGHGISADYCEQLFTRFSRGAEGINSAERGIGLGLAIARELTERQGGAIWLEYTSPEGSMFSLTLPCTQAEPIEREATIATVV